jgi:serine/threonine protein kinase
MVKRKIDSCDGEFIGEGSFAKVYRREDGLVAKEFNANDEISPFELELLFMSKNGNGGDNLASATQILLMLTGKKNKKFSILMPNYGEQIHEIPFAMVFHYSRQLEAGLKWLHDRNIVHMDVAANNVMIDHNKKRLTLCDFGLSLCIPGDASAVFDTMVRTNDKYCPPEMMQRSYYPGPPMPVLGTEGRLRTRKDPLTGYIYSKYVDYYNAGKVFEFTSGTELEMITGFIPGNIQYMINKLMSHEPYERAFVYYAEDVSQSKLEESHRSRMPFSCRDDGDVVKLDDQPHQRFGICSSQGTCFGLVQTEAQFVRVPRKKTGPWDNLLKCCTTLLDITLDAKVSVLALWADIVLACKLTKKNEHVAAFCVAVNYSNYTHYFEEHFKNQVDLNALASIYTQMCWLSDRPSASAALANIGGLGVLIDTLLKTNWSSVTSFVPFDQRKLPFDQIFLRDVIFTCD